MNDGKYTLADGADLRVWTNPTGDRWACAAPGHSAFCRLCQPVDEITEAMLNATLEGWMEVRHDLTTGEFEFRLTPEGERCASDLIKQLSPEEAEE